MPMERTEVKGEKAEKEERVNDDCAYIEFRLTINPERSEYFFGGLNEGGASMLASVISKKN